MAATMMSVKSIRAPALRDAFRSATKPSPASRNGLRVLAQMPPSGGSAPSSTATPDEILSYAKTLPGISQPFPEIFDPANLLSNATSIQEVRRWRESEITHGRVAMLAALGWIVGEFVADKKLLVNADGRIGGPAIDQFQQVEAKGAIFWEPLVFAIGLAEAWRIGVGWANPTSDKFNQLRDDYNMGEIGFDPLGLCPTDPKEKYDLQTKELNNGRLAMIGIAGFVAQELVKKQEIFYQTADKVSPTL
ncbi:Light-harvesting complex stress-related protein 1, chloroplastic [Coccomyxa sp. Obi]|nr:Light-harvesting complex stress-related protein 1, chloroplastic [Coccomyxa sp. Obi]